MTAVERLPQALRSSGNSSPTAGAWQPGPIRVMICDDSPVARSMLRNTLAFAEGVSFAGHAAHGAEAVARFQANPSCAQVLVMDIEMPVMDGLTALPLLLKASPTLRVLISSALTARGAATTLSALRLGAVDYVLKPSAQERDGMATFQQEILDKIHGLTRQAPPGGVAVALPLQRLTRIRPALLAIGSSTGGPQALATVLQALKRHLRQQLDIPVIVTQHMPAAFTPLLAEQLTRLGGIPCSEARDGAPLRPGHIHLAPGGRHMLVSRGPLGLVTRLSDDPPENHCRPAIDTMLRSAVAATAGPILMLMLTGMGCDGLAGTRTLVAAGGVALAQDESSSIVWGMPGAIARAGLCQAVLPLEDLARQAAHMLGPV